MIKNIFTNMIVICFIVSQIACSTSRVPVYTSQNNATHSPHFNPNTKYEFVLFNQTNKIHVKGSQIRQQNRNIYILNGDGTVFQAFSKDKVAAIYEIDQSNNKSRKKDMLKGLIYGAGAGVVVGSISGYLISRIDLCSDTGCTPNEGMPTTGALAGLGIFVLTSLIGLGIGALPSSEAKQKKYNNTLQTEPAMR